LIPNPIHKVLSTLCTHEVRYLLMGGQACVLYGAAEFSRDCDIAILCDKENLNRLRAALADLQAEVIAVPPFEEEYLQRGHAVHFRCRAQGATDVRLDVMAKMRGVANFDELWARRTTLEDDAGTRLEVLSLSDLIAAKKTQRDKDWPMIRRLVEAHYVQHADEPDDESLHFWLSNLRTPSMLIDLAAKHPVAASMLASQRPLLHAAIDANQERLVADLLEEEMQERSADQAYWQPLKVELEAMRRQRRQ
jgi:hypothetical protein